MAKVEGLKEKVHYSLYDAFFVPAPPATGAAPTFKTSMADPRVIRFFVDVQNKTPLETNMQAAGTLPSQNSYEVRAMRVVVSSLLPRKDDPKIEKARLSINEPEILGLLLYGSVTSLIVGEKIMIQQPTFGFPSGGGPAAGLASVATNGIADPSAIFKFAEPVPITAQQNFRVEMQFPRDIPDGLAEVHGPLRVWVMLDGYLIRDVQ